MIFSLQPITNGTGATRGPGRRSCGSGTPSVALADAIGRLEVGTDYHYVSAGAWSVHDLVRYVLDTTGPGEVQAFTWSLTTTAADALLDMLASGAITQLDLVMDAAQKKLSRGAYETIRSHCRRVRLTQIHAKGFLLAAGDWRVSVATSQNFTQNPRYEVGVLSTAPEVYAFHRLWLDPLLDGGDPLDVETAKRTTLGEGD